MGKYKNLLKNTGLLTLSSFSTKIISFFLVPLYTYILTTEEYGTFDILTTTVALLVPLLTVCIQEGIMRYCFEQDADKTEILSLGILIVSVSSIIVLAFSLLGKILGVIAIENRYIAYFIIIYLTNALGGILAYFARGINNVKIVAVNGVLSFFITVLCNLLFLLYFKWGLDGYFLATITGQLVSCVYLWVGLKAHTYIVINKALTNLQKEIIKYSAPMMLNTISWWVNSASDRYIVTLMYGLGINGLYSVAHKIPSLINMAQSIFSQAWSISAVLEYDTDGKTTFYSRTYSVYSMVLILGSSGLILADKMLAKILFSSDFYHAWEYVPFLVISVMFSGIASFWGGILSALKKTDTFAKTSAITAIVNLILNIILVKIIGAVGATISTAIAFMLMAYMRYNTIKKYIRLEINRFRDCIAFGILFCQAYLLVFSKNEHLFSLVQVVIFLIVFVLYKQEYILLSNMGIKLIKGRKSK